MQRGMLFLLNAGHTILYTDTGVGGWMLSGFSQKEAILFSVIISSIAFSFSFFVVDKIVERLEKWKKMETRVSKIVKRWGYWGLFICVIVPFVPWIKEIALVSGRVFGYRYVFPVMLLGNSLRIALLGCFYGNIFNFFKGVEAAMEAMPA